MLLAALRMPFTLIVPVVIPMLPFEATATLALTLIGVPEVVILTCDPLRFIVAAVAPESAKVKAAPPVGAMLIVPPLVAMDSAAPAAAVTVIALLLVPELIETLVAPADVIAELAPMLMDGLLIVRAPAAVIDSLVFAAVEIEAPVA